ncbi:uncharacterized protein LOC133299789 [Gastrolobium bilobum]|uniref:uncharacterized protein LOC133299789 n=1 Tax=Gastrolobium bilobum TaxID=150636 RepID=UPI002AB11E8F|nr:uncharacterized protein LOC133299789 [Gastrolobium bilobum]
MGYIYEAMDKAKEAIQITFRGIGKEDKYREIIAIIDKKWDCQLHHPLHAIGHYLNPQYFYSNPKLDEDLEVVNGYLKCFERLTANEDEMNQVMDELELYKKAQGLFGMDSAKRQRDKFNGGGRMKKIAIKVLSLTCSSSRCEHNWSIFEHIHSKKRSRLDNQKFCRTCRDLIDPILLNGFDESNEWLVGDMGGDGEHNENKVVFEGDTLTWVTLQM